MGQAAAQPLLHFLPYDFEISAVAYRFIEVLGLKVIFYALLQISGKIKALRQNGGKAR